MADEMKSFDEFTKFIKRKSNDGITKIIVAGPDYIDYKMISDGLISQGYSSEEIRLFEDKEVINGPDDVKDFKICVGVPSAIEQVMLMFGENLVVVLLAYTKKMLESYISSEESGVTDRSKKDISYNEIYGKVRQGQLLRSEVNTLSTLILHVVLDLPSEGIEKREPKIEDKSIKKLEVSESEINSNDPVLEGSNEQ